MGMILAVTAIFETQLEMTAQCQLKSEKIVDSWKEFVRVEAMPLHCDLCRLDN
jgi:hypothetical protein